MCMTGYGKKASLRNFTDPAYHLWCACIHTCTCAHTEHIDTLSHSEQFFIYLFIFSDGMSSLFTKSLSARTELCLACLYSLALGSVTRNFTQTRKSTVWTELKLAQIPLAAHECRNKHIYPRFLTLTRAQHSRAITSQLAVLPYQSLQPPEAFQLVADLKSIVSTFIPPSSKYSNISESTETVS